MSVVRNSYTWRAGIINSSLPSTTKLVLLTLSCHFNDAGEACYPSQRLLAKEAGLTERAIVTHLGSARELGWLQFSKHGFAGQKWANNQYMPSFPEGTEPRSAPCEKGSEPHSAPCGKGTEPNDKKVLNDVHTNYSVELLSLNTTTTTVPEAHLNLVIEDVLTKFKSQLLHALQYEGVTDQSLAQDMVDELADAIELGQRGERPRVGSPIAWLRALIKRHAKGKFDRVGCLRIQSRRFASNGAQQRPQPSTQSPRAAVTDGERQRIAEIVQHQRQQQHKVLSLPGRS